MNDLGKSINEMALSLRKGMIERGETGFSHEDALEILAKIGVKANEIIQQRGEANRVLAERGDLRTLVV